MRRVLIVGQNPGPANTDPERPFAGTKSGRTLQSWLRELGLQESEVVLMNASDIVGRRPNVAEIRSNLPWFCFTHCIALGAVASRALLQSGCSYNLYFRLPHPSGLNRKLNDKAALKEALHNCKEYLQTKRLAP